MYYKCKIMINRINLILRAKNITARQFAEEIGIQPSGMSHIMGGRNNPSLEFVSKVLRRYPEIDANWLLLGKGEMYSSATPAAMGADLPIREPVDKPQQEPSLFDGESTGQMKVEEPIQDDLFPQDTKVEEERRYAPGYIASAPELPAGCARRVERIFLIYSDNTFKELLPQD